MGDRELGMLEVIRKSRYRGPVGIMNLDRNRDAEVGLKLNMEGLKRLLRGWVISKPSEPIKTSRIH